MTDNRQEMTVYPRLMFWYLVIWAALSLILSLIMLGDLILHPLAADMMTGNPVVRVLVGLLIAPATILVGVLILHQEPRNLVGLCLIIFGGAMYLTATMRNDIQDDFLLSVNIWYGSFAYLVPLILLILYFPNGRSFPPRLSPFIDVFTFVTTVPFSVATFFSGSIPFAADVANRLMGSNSPWVIEFPTVIFLMLYTLYARYRRGDARQRLQMRGFAGFTFSLLCIFGLLLVVRNFVPEVAVFSKSFQALFFLVLFAFPAVSVGNAILRHNLYDINIIIRRTLIYSILTTILAVIYFGGIALAQRLFHVVTGENSDLAIVVSTLLIAALFSPIRARVQNVIDRRLYRRKYNVEQTLAQFQHNLRNEVDVETLKANLLKVVSETMHPDKIALWVKGENG